MLWGWTLILRKHEEYWSWDMKESKRNINIDWYLITRQDFEIHFLRLFLKTIVRILTGNVFHRYTSVRCLVPDGNIILGSSWNLRGGGLGSLRHIHRSWILSLFFFFFLHSYRFLSTMRWVTSTICYCRYPVLSYHGPRSIGAEHEGLNC